MDRNEIVQKLKDEGRKLMPAMQDPPPNSMIETPEVIMALFTDLRELLRRNGDWKVKISVLGLYGTIGLEIYRLSTLKHSEHGMSLYKRLFNAIKFLHEEGLS